MQSGLAISSAYSQLESLMSNAKYANIIDSIAEATLTTVRATCYKAEYIAMIYMGQQEQKKSAIV